MARLLRSNIQDFVQEVPAGQMAQGTLFRCLLMHVPERQHAYHFVSDAVRVIADGAVYGAQ